MMRICSPKSFFFTAREIVFFDSSSSRETAKTDRTRATGNLRWRGKCTWLWDVLVSFDDLDAVRHHFIFIAAFAQVIYYLGPVAIGHRAIITSVI